MGAEAKGVGEGLEDPRAGQPTGVPGLAGLVRDVGLRVTGVRTRVLILRPGAGDGMGGAHSPGEP
jgi:hypothetical protein